MIDTFYRVLLVAAVAIGLSNSYFYNEQFIKLPFSYDGLKTDFYLMEDFVKRASQCASKCSQKRKECISFAWNEQTLKCLLYNRNFKSMPSPAQIYGEWEYYSQECSRYLKDGMINMDIDKLFIPGVTMTGSCNDGYVAVSGQINATCNPNFQTVVSDTCREVLQNIAVGKPTEQSSTYWQYVSGFAVDGIRSTDLGVSCTHTDTSDNKPWWRVDLLKVYYIVTVRMLNRGMDQSGIDSSHRLRNVSIRTGKTSSNISTLCGFYAGPGTLGELVSVNCPPSTTGRYVKISLVTEYLTLCEVDVFVALV